LIEFDQVTVQRGGKLILDRISFEIKAGSKVAIQGRSGAGKTSILLALTGVLIPDAGTIRFNGQPVDHRTVTCVRTAVGFIGQEPVMGAETVRGALLLPFQFRANRERMPAEGDILETLSRLALDPDILGRHTSVISGGEKQRVAIARALLLHKTVLLADEVTSALDDESKRAVIKILDTPGLTILSVSHDRKWISRCDQLLKVDRGRLTEAEGTHGNH